MSRNIRRAARIVPLLSTATAVVGTAMSAPVGAQSVMVRVALQGAAQGKISGASNGSSTGEIDAYAFSMSQPYGAATPVLHLTTNAYAAPRVLQALATNEILVNPTVTFVKPIDHGGRDSVVYRIRATHGNIINAAVVLDTHHVPSMTFDVLLGGGVSFTTAGNPVPAGWSTGGAATNTANTANTQPVATTAPPPTVSGAVPAATGAQQIVGKFTGQTSGNFPSDPAVARLGGILIDSVELSMSAPVANGAASGRPMLRPLVIAHPANVDASVFAAAHASGETFSKIEVLVFEPSINGNPVETLLIESDDACDVTTSSCSVGNGSGLAGGKSGASAGASSQRAQPALVAPGSRMAMVSGTAVLQVRPNVIKVTNRQSNGSFTYTP